MQEPTSSLTKCVNVPATNVLYLVSLVVSWAPLPNDRFQLAPVIKRLQMTFVRSSLPRSLLLYLALQQLKPHLVQILQELTPPSSPLMEKTRSFSASQQCLKMTSSSSSDPLPLRRAV